MHRDPYATSAALQSPLPSSDWRSWAHDPAEPVDGPGLLVSRMFWLGGGVSLLMWGCATWLALYFT